MQLLHRLNVKQVVSHSVYSYSDGKDQQSLGRWLALTRMLILRLPPCNNFRRPGLPQLSFKFPLGGLEEFLEIQPLCFFIFLGLQDHLQLQTPGSSAQTAVGVDCPVQAAIWPLDTSSPLQYKQEICQPCQSPSQGEPQVSALPHTPQKAP